jgi:beta-lactam-binding protein with PASTA domain
VAPSQRYEGISPELDAVVLKALTKNPENRYQTAAEMRADLVRVHNGEAPEAPKVLTEADRSSLLAAPAPSRGGPDATEQIPRQKAHLVEHDRRTGGGVGRWVIAVAVLAVLTVVVTLAINFLGGDTRKIQVPDVANQLVADATATLQNRGFKVSVNRTPDSTIQPERVISSSPAADASVEAGDVITVNVSTGPEQRQVPDCAGLSQGDCVQKLKAAGFTRYGQESGVSSPEQVGKVLLTNPPANQLSAVTNEITIVLGSGPGKAIVPSCVGQTVDVCKQLLTASNFKTPIEVPTDSTEPAGKIVGTNPPANQEVPLDTPIQLQVSLGNQFEMPNLQGQFWTDAEPYLRQLGWTGGLIKGPNVDNSGQKSNAVVTQSPLPGAGVNFNSSITLNFAS